MPTLETRLDQAQLKVGDRLSRVSYMEIVSKSRGVFNVKNEEGLEWTIAGNILQNEAYAADQYTEERQLLAPNW